MSGYDPAGTQGVPGAPGAVLVSSVAGRQGAVALTVADVAGASVAAEVAAALALKQDAASAATDTELARAARAADAAMLRRISSTRPLRVGATGTSIVAGGLRSIDGAVVSFPDPNAPAVTWAAMDSIGVQQHGPQSFLTWLALRSNGAIVAAINGAIASSRLTWHVPHFYADVLAHRPDCVIVGDATNDINNGATDADIRANIENLIDQARQYGVIPILQTTTPRNDNDASALRTLTHNAWVRTFAASTKGVILSDLFDAVGDYATGHWVTAANTSDGLHPTEIGARVLADRLLADLAPFVEYPYTLLRLLPWIVQAVGAPNLFPENPLFTADVNADGIPDYWSRGGTAITNSTLDVDPLVIGKAWHLSATTPAMDRDLAVDGAAISVGDRLAFSGLFKVNANARTLAWRLGIASLGGPNPREALAIAANLEDLPTWTAFYTELVVPAGATIIRTGAHSQTNVPGQFWAAQWQLLNLTKLGKTHAI